MLTTSEMTRIARAVIAIRPEWDLNDTFKLIDQRLKNHDFQSLAVAAIWVASDPLTKKFIRIESEGPWWNLIGQPTLLASIEIPDNERCVTCFRNETNCNGIATQTHQFKSVTQWNIEAQQAKNDPTAKERKELAIAQMRQKVALARTANKPKCCNGECQCG